MHLATAQHLRFAHNRNVVLSLAGHDTGITPQTGALINDHAPSVALVSVGWIQGLLGWRQLPHLLRKLGVLHVLREGTGPYQMAPFHAVMLLRRGQRIARTRGMEFQPMAKPPGIR